MTAISFSRVCLLDDTCSLYVCLLIFSSIDINAILGHFEKISMIVLAFFRCTSETICAEDNTLKFPIKVVSGANK